ncbi:hypothetical protein EDD11_003646 [Mortierella claussenii]|nr:hypothetical protein EDD11_003646 [Mortierella claussenii]
MVDDAFLDALEARAYIYLQSILCMQRPLLHARLMAQDLAEQWKRLDRGRRELEPSRDIKYLEERQILEHGLDTTFVVRLNLATFAHDLISATDLELKSCKECLRGFTKLLMNKNEPLSPVLKAIFFQLLAVILVQKVKSLSSLPSASSPDTIRMSIASACTSDNIPELSIVSNMVVTPVIDLATSVFNSKTQLRAVYNDTLRRIFERISSKLQPLAPIAHSDFARKELETWKKQFFAKTQGISATDKDSLYDNEDWLTLPPQSKDDEEMHSSQPSPDLEVDHGQDFDMDMDMENDEQDQYEEQQQETQQRQYTPKKKVVLKPSPLKKHHDPATTKPAPPSTSSPSKRTSLARNAIASKKAVKSIDTDLSSSDENQEPVSVPPKRLKRQIQEEDMEDEDGFITDPDEPANSSSTDATTAPTSAKKVRKRTRHWTVEEVERLMKLVDRFKYDDSEVGDRKRTIKWAQLKAYDAQRGNVLKARNQVQLKDKYREQTDNGRHRDHVKALYRARHASEKP